ncbi:MAG: hypothetical protein KDK40_02980, partial [Chlamydiia bacterium]|nr:hypothetical protein [Chlamydiia bacterium]
YSLFNLSELETTLGEPPPDSRGLLFAIQVLLYNHHLLFFRVEEEGFSTSDYLLALHMLDQAFEKKSVEALAAPGVCGGPLMDEVHKICERRDLLLLTNEADLYDYLTDTK